MDIKLQLGDESSLVKTLQEKLKQLGFYNPVVTGKFGPATEVGVKALQKELGLEEDGIVNSELWEFLLSSTEVSFYSDVNNPTLKLGDSGSDVSRLQQKLKALLYYTGNITSNFDNEVENAVKRFQYNNGLTTSGIVNNQTWTFIDYLYGNLDSCVTGEEEDIESGTYVVQKGDTLWSISRKFDTSVDTIKSLNNLVSNNLVIGQILKVPSSDDNILYTVQKGDTLWSISRKFNVSVDTIKRANNLSGNVLSIGQVLNIPASSGTTYYTVQKGDTLWIISRKFNISVDKIKSLNNLTSNTLSIGQVLKIET